MSDTKDVERCVGLALRSEASQNKSRKRRNLPDGKVESYSFISFFRVEAFPRRTFGLENPQMMDGENIQDTALFLRLARRWGRLSPAVDSNGNYFYTGDNFQVGYQGSSPANSRPFPSALPFRATPLPAYQQEEYLQPSAFQLPPTYDPFGSSPLQNQLRGGQNGFHTNQHLPQPFHPQSRRFPTSVGDAGTGLDYSDHGGNRYQDIVRGQGAISVDRPSYQPPPSRAAPTGPALSAGAAYQEIVRSTGASFFPSRPSGLVDQLDSNRWRTSGNSGTKRKLPQIIAVPPPVEEPVRDIAVNTLPSAVSSGSVDSDSAIFDRNSTSPGSRGRSRFKNARVESTPFTVETTSSTASSYSPTRASRTRRPTEIKRVTTLRPTTARSTTSSTTTTTSTTESPHYDPDYELEYILEPEDDGLQEELPALLGPNNNITLPLSPPLIPNLKFEEDLSAAFLPPGYKKDSPTPPTTTQPPITTFTPRNRITQGSPRPPPTTKRPSTTTTPRPTTLTTSPSISSTLPSESAGLLGPNGRKNSIDSDNSSESPTESWVVVASVQTSRSVSGARFLPGHIVKQEETQRHLTPNGTIEKNTDTTEPPPSSPSTHLPSPPSTKGSTESIIDKLDRVQSELSSGILSGFRPGDSKLDIPDMPENKTASESLAAVPSTVETSASSSTEAPITSTEASTSRPRTFVPSGKRTTLKPKKSLLDSIQYDEIGTGLLPPGFKPRESTFKPKQSSRESGGRSAGSTFKNSVKDDGSKATSSEKETSSHSTNRTLESIIGKITFDDVSSLLPRGYNPEKSDVRQVPKNPKQEADQSKSDKPKPGIIKEDEIPDSLLPAGFKKGRNKPSAAKEEEPAPVEAILKKVQFKDVSSLLPAGFKEKSNAEPNLTGLLPPGYKVNTSETETASENTTSAENNKVVFPSRPGGNRKPPPPRSKPGGGLIPQAPKIQKGWPVRASTEFTGWPSSSTTPVSIDQIREKARQDSAKILEYNRMATSTDAPSTRETITSTARSTTTRGPTTPGYCDSDCDMVATLRLIGGAKWKPELLQPKLKEWQDLANEVVTQLEAVYSSSDSLSKWYKKITIDAFSEGSILVDYVVELTDLGRTVSTADMKRLFHESLAKYTANQAALAGDTNAALDTSNQTEYRVGKFVIDPNYTEFTVLPRRASPTVALASEEGLLPQWAIAVIVIGLASLLFVIIFGVTVLVNRHKSAKKKQPTTLTEDMLSELNKNHMGGLDNFGADDLYNMEDVWADKPVAKMRRSSASIQENSMANLYDSWRSEWNGYYFNAYYGNGSNGGYGMSRRRSDYDTNF